MKSDMRQLHLRDTFEPRHLHEMSSKEKSEVLESHMFRKLERGVKINGRAVASGNKLRDFITKQKASPATVGAEAVLVSCVIDAQEHQDIATIDILDMFIQTIVYKIEDIATIILQGALVDVMIEIAPDIYGLYVSTDKKGVKTLIIRCHNAIYGTMVSSVIY